MENPTERAAQFLKAAEVAQRYAAWKVNQQRFHIPIDPELKKIADAYGASFDDELRNHFLDAVAIAEATLQSSKPEEKGVEDAPTDSLD